MTTRITLTAATAGGMLAAATALAAGLLVGQATAPEQGPSMLQSQFPCNEDEVLGYDPQFGPDRVGCIHREQIEGRIER